MLTDWDGKVDNWSNVFDHQSQSPFGLLTDWDRESRVPQGSRRRGVSIAFRLADGLGPVSFAEAALPEPVPVSQSPFGLLTDWDAVIAEIKGKMK